MEKEKQDSEHIIRGAETDYTPSMAEDEEEHAQPLQSPCNFAWEVCDRRG